MAPLSAWAVLLLKWWEVVPCDGFPDSQDPTTADPPIPRAAVEEPCGVARSIVGATFASYGYVARAQYEPPSHCKGPWSQIIMDLHGAVLAPGKRDVQFDRYGMLWLRGVEILRLTTPEPCPKGISWHTSKDLTEYADIFTAPGEVAMMIPNVVESQYTGVIHINVSFTFYESSHGNQSALLRQVLPLRNVSGANSPINNITVNSEDGQENLVIVPRDTVQARLDLYASGHACEEFWYTNNLTAGPGVCGGGAYRELLVYVDGHLAGGQFPFPVIYTGGINPLLWRPLTGIYSFDIPPYTFDLTPFLAWLVDGKPHNITLDVFDSSGATWYLDGVLILQREAGSPGVGSVEVISADMPQVIQKYDTLENSNVSNSNLQSMRGTHSYEIRGKLQRSNGAMVASRVAGTLSAWSLNLNNTTKVAKNKYNATSITEGEWFLSSVREIGKEQIAATYRFPLYLLDKSTDALSAAVNYSRKALTTYQELNDLNTSKGQPIKSYTVAVSNSISTDATYGGRFSNGSSIEMYKIWTFSDPAQAWMTISPNDAAIEKLEDRQPCFHRSMSALNGGISKDKVWDKCKWPHGVYVCGGTLCGDFNEFARTAAKHSSSVTPISAPSNQTFHTDDLGDLMVVLRSPRAKAEAARAAQAAAKAAALAVKEQEQRAAAAQLEIYM